MRIVILILSLSLCSAVLHASEKEIKNNLFKCVDKASLVLDQSCIETTLESDMSIQQQGFKIAGLNGDLGENAMATMSFYPEKMLIEIVAHADDSNNGLVSRVSSN